MKKLLGIIATVLVFGCGTVEHETRCTFTGCDWSKYEKIAQTEIERNPPPPPEITDSTCHIEEDVLGARIICDDGSEVVINQMPDLFCTVKRVSCFYVNLTCPNEDPMPIYFPFKGETGGYRC
jgi:hypothetical protein